MSASFSLGVNTVLLLSLIYGSLLLCISTSIQGVEQKIQQHQTEDMIIWSIIEASFAFKSNNYKEWPLIMLVQYGLIL